MDRGNRLAAVLAIAVFIGCSNESGDGATGRGGTTAPGGSGGSSGAAGGSPGLAGSSAGGVTGAAGATAPGGAGGSSAGGATSTGGTTATAGAGGAGGTTATAGAGGAGGTMATAGMGGTTATAGAGGSGGPTASAGTGGTGGPTGNAGGSGGQAGGGASGRGGSSASAGASGGGTAGTGPSDGGTSDAASGGTSGGSGATIKKFIGNISPKNKDIPANFADMWQQVSLEANSKWGFVQSSSATQWNWAPVDQVYKYAMDHNIVFKQHNFFWNFEQPSWANSNNVATAGPAWVKAFCDRYPGTTMIDVVNEPMHNPAPYAAGMGGAGTSGWDWVVNAFKWARQSCPNAILILNEFNIIEYDNDNASFIAMLQKVLKAGAPVDAIGAQGHDVYKIGAAKAKTYLDKLASTFNLPIYITELDIDQSNDAMQKQLMQDEITMFWNHPSVKGITYWGYIKGTTWRTNAWLVDTSGKARPAMTWLQDFIHGTTLQRDFIHGG